MPCRISFVKQASHEGISSGSIETLIGLTKIVFGQDILAIEDIMDTGATLSKTLDELKKRGAKSVEVVVLLRKAKAKKPGP